jgi:hypothetical protein
MSLNRFTNNSEILNSKANLEGLVLRTVDINSISQDIAVLSDYINNNNGRYNLNVDIHAYNSSGDYILSEYGVEFIHSTEYSDFTIDIASFFDRQNLLAGQFKLNFSYLINLLGDNEDLPLTLQEISPNRTELKFIVKDSYVNRFPNIRSRVEEFKKLAANLKYRDYLNNIVINFGKNLTAQVVNIKVDCSNELVIYCKLYSELLDEVVENTNAYLCYKVLEDYIDVFTIRPSEVKQVFNVLKGPDYSTCSQIEVSNETNVKTWNSLLDTDSKTSNLIIKEIFSGSDEVKLNIDYTDFKNFVYYGSATERLKNYDFKVKLIEYYDSQYKLAINSVSGSSQYIQNSANNYIDRINKIENNFDNFENYLYYKTGSIFSYDVSGSIVPSPKTIQSNKYINYPSTSSQYISWYNTTLSASINFDRKNYTSFYFNTPDHILRDERNSQYVAFIHMIGQHFDEIYTYVRKLTSIHERDEHPERGIPNELLPYYVRSLGWKIQNTRNLSDLWLYKLGVDSTGSYSVPSGDLISKSHENLSQQIWRRVVNNLPYMLKTKGTSRSVRALFSIYGIPFTLVSVKEYGGPQQDEDNPPILSEDNFQYLLNFTQNEYIEVPRRFYTSSLGYTQQIPQTTEFRFQTDYTGSVSMSLWAVEDYADRTNILQNLEIVHYTASLYGKNTYGYLRYSIKTGSIGDFYTLTSTSSLLPLFDDDIWTVRMYSEYPIVSGSKFNGILSIDVAKSSDFVENRISLSSSFAITANTASLYYSLGADNTILPTGHYTVIGGTTGSNSTRFSGSIQSYKEYFTSFSKKVFDEHVLNPSSYHLNTYSASFDNLFRYYPLGLDNIRNDHTVYTVVSSSHPNQRFYGTNTGLFKNFAGDQTSQYLSKVETYYRYFPSLGANNPKSNKIRFDNNKLIGQLSPDKKATQSRYLKEQKDSNRLAIVFSPTDQINKDIANQFGPYNFENFVGDPKDSTKPNYPSLEIARNEYFKKFARANDIGKFIEIFSLYDYSVFEQVKQLVPARANLVAGVLIEPHILERPKIPRSFPKIEVLDKDTLLEGARLGIDSNFIPTLPTTIKHPLELEVEREKRRTIVKRPVDVEIIRSKNTSRLRAGVDVEVERNKLKSETNLSIYSFDLVNSGQKVFNTEIIASDVYRFGISNVVNGTVVPQTTTYVYKNSNGVTKTKTITEDLYKPLGTVVPTIIRNIASNDLLNIENLGIGSFYVYDTGSNEVSFRSDYLDNSTYTFYFTTIEPDVSQVTALTGPEFKEFIEKYNFSVYNNMTTIFRDTSRGSIFNIHISSSRTFDTYKTIEYFYSSSGDFQLGYTSPNMLKSPVYLKNFTGSKSGYEKELDYTINKEYDAYYSSSLKSANYQHFEDSRIMSVRFNGSKLIGAGINIDSTATISGGPVVTVKIVNENDIIVQ